MSLELLQSTLPIVNFKGPRESVNYEEKLTVGRVSFASKDTERDWTLELTLGRD